MSRLVVEHLAERGDYRGGRVGCKEKGREEAKSKLISDGEHAPRAESRTQILAHGSGGSRIVRRVRKSKIRAATRVSSDLVSATIAMVMEASYTCDSCGEEIVIPIDPSAGSSQEYVEDCPVCCSANVIRVKFDDDEAFVSAQAE